MNKKIKFKNMQLVSTKTNELLNSNQEEVIKLREQFVSIYCNDRGWDKSNLEFEQVLEIRSNTTWKNPYMLRS